MRASGQTGSPVQQTPMSEARIFQPFFTHLPTSSVLMLVMNVCRSFPLITVELYLHAPEYLQNKYISYCAANTCTALLPTKKKFGVTLFKMLVNNNKFQCTAASVCVIYCWNVFFFLFCLCFGLSLERFSHRIHLLSNAWCVKRWDELCRN